MSRRCARYRPGWRYDERCGSWRRKGARQLCESLHRYARTGGRLSFAARRARHVRRAVIDVRRNVMRVGRAHGRRGCGCDERCAAHGAVQSKLC